MRGVGREEQRNKIMAWASVRCITALLSVVLAALAALSVEG